MKKILLLIDFMGLVLFSFCQAPHHYQVVKTFPVTGDGWWDYIAVNDGKLYVAHGTQVNILDEPSGKPIGVIPNTQGVHGIAFDKALHKGFTSNGRSNNVFVFDLETNRISDSISTGQNPDAIFYEPYTKTIVTCNGSSHNLSVIDPETDRVVHTIAVGGKPETAVSNGAGLLFVNLEDKNSIAVVDLKSFKMKAQWPLHAEGPTGLAYDSKSSRLFAGCEKELVVLDAVSGKGVAKLPIGAGCDGVVFDEGKQLIFTANGEGTISVIQERNANDFKILDTIATKRGARTITIDKKEGMLYLPTADFEKQTSANGRPTMKPGTFQVLVMH